MTIRGEGVMLSILCIIISVSDFTIRVIITLMEYLTVLLKYI